MWCQCTNAANLHPYAAEVGKAANGDANNQLFFLKPFEPF
jgi:hypothetical protein